MWVCPSGGGKVLDEIDTCIIYGYKLHSLLNKKVIGEKDHGKNYIKVRPPLVRHLLRIVYCLRSIIKGQLQRFYNLVSYERAVKILENDIFITEIVQAVLEIFEFKVEFPRKILKIRNFANLRIIRVEQ